MFMTPANKYVKFHQNPLSLTLSGFMFATCKTSGFVVIDLSLLFLSNGISFFLAKEMFFFAFHADFGNLSRLDAATLVDQT